MDFDRSDQEPEEYDPEAAFEDPESDTLTIPRVEPPTVEVPSVEIPEVETPESEVPSELRRGFWALVFVLNVAILLLALAPMLAYFERAFFEAGVLLIGGLVLLGLAYRRYRRLRSMDLDAWDDEDDSLADEDRRPNASDGRDGDDSAGRDDGPHPEP